MTAAIVIGSGVIGAAVAVELQRGGYEVTVVDRGPAAGAGVDECVDRTLWRLGQRPLTISKYGVGMAALHPGLPANKWHRTLARHVVADKTADVTSGTSCGEVSRGERRPVPGL